MIPPFSGTERRAETKPAMKIGFIGLGNMGCSLAQVIALNRHDVLGWEHDKKIVEEINTKHHNSRFLPGVSLHPRIAAAPHLSDVFKECNIIFVAIHTRFVRDTLAPAAAAVLPDTLFVVTAKGIDAKTGKTASQTISSLFPSNKQVIFSGPTIASEFAEGLPTVVQLAAEEKSTCLRVSRVVENNHFRTVFSEDMTGAELGGILKNIYALGLGIFDGAGITGKNFVAAYLTFALGEMATIGLYFGAQKETFYCLAGCGDLLATSMSSKSHHYTAGKFISLGFSPDVIQKKMGVLPEGFTTLHTIMGIARKNNIQLPIAEEIEAIIDGKKATRESLFAFFHRMTKHPD
ncbi:hypothetical protein COY95_03275 [Candidatus Woesearchaeota archaeon CG_4_10_14_0_8_um_filter_47_5]|nr:MAG: hypothetical protein COY95_03275 [Candidatus Woesearchaeota archaeon CG_4_10_14_0_8_um_filter_47_5]